MQVVLGIIAGLIVGAIFEDGRAVFVGGLIGALFGFLFRAVKGRTDAAEKFTHVYSSLADIHRRLTVLEQASGLAPVTTEMTQTAPPTAKPEPVRETVPAARAAPQAASA